MGEEFIKLPTNNYSIYINNGYYVCISDIEQRDYKLFMGFADKDLLTLSKEEIIEEIRKISELVNSINQSGIYVLPVISPLELEQAAKENDDKMFNELMVRRIQPITNEIYISLKNKNKNLHHVINMIKQTDADRKFIDWLDMKLMRDGIDYIHDIEYEQLKADYIQSINNNAKEVAVNTTGIKPIDRTYENMEAPTKNNHLVKKLVKPSSWHGNSFGFSNILFIATMLLVALALGIGISYLIIK